MTSGIPSYTASIDFQQRLFADPTRPWNPDELIDFIRTTPPDLAPGTRSNYSNYVLLGTVIEQVTGQPIEDVFQDRLFGPWRRPTPRSRRAARTSPIPTWPP